MKVIHNKKEESGQVLVLLTVGLIALLGLTALAIDGGQIYADRRYDQNVADGAAYAGGGAAALEMENSYITNGNFNCSSANMNVVKMAAAHLAITRAANNGFTLDEDLSDKSGVEVTCGIDLKNGIPDPYVDVKVNVTTNVETAFAHLFYSGKVANTVESVVRVRPRSNIAAGYAIIATSLTSSKAIWAHGTPDTVINGGGILSNAGITGNGSFTARVNPNTLPIHYVTGSAPTGAWTPRPTKIPAPIPIPEIPAPDCDALPSRNTSGSTWHPGNYGGARLNAKDDITLEPGLYCFDNLEVQANASLTGTGVTIYVRGDIHFNGNGQLHLSAPTGENQPAIRNVLFYCAPNTSPIINGNSDSEFTGTIYCPESDLTLNGTGDTYGYHSQIIGRTVELGGTAYLKINYNSDENYTRPTFLELNK